MRIKGFKVLWSDGFMLGLILLAFTPLLPPPDRFPLLSISATFGHRLYLAGIAVCAIGYFLLRARENQAAALEMDGLKKQITTIAQDAVDHDRESERRHATEMAASDAHFKTQLADAQQKHDLQMSAALQHKVEIRADVHEIKTFLTTTRQELKDAEVADAPPIKVAGLSSAVTLAEALAAEEAYAFPYQLLQNRQRLIAPLIQPFLGAEELPTQMLGLQAAMRDIDAHPPTDPETAFAAAKQLSSLSQAIPNTTGGTQIAEHKAEIVNFSPRSDSSSGAYRPPKSS